MSKSNTILELRDELKSVKRQNSELRNWLGLLTEKMSDKAKKTEAYKELQKLLKEPCVTHDTELSRIEIHEYLRKNPGIVQNFLNESQDTNKG